MKNLILTSLFLGIVSYAVQSWNEQRIQANVKVETFVDASTISYSAISVTFYQDASGSIKDNGIEIISTGIFMPYFDDVTRDIQLSFGIIDNLSAEKLIAVSMAKLNFFKPTLQDLRNLNVVERRKEKERFESALKKYKVDSIQYYQDRRTKIKDFCKRAETVLDVYRTNLSGQTDLKTAIDIADKVFEFPDFSSSKNFLLLYSDGQDTYHRKIKKLRNKAEVILINAGRDIPTSVDAIISKKLQSPEQAIKYTLIP
ncbi:MAG TPA: hypothetical protein PLS73_06785 [Saprospiraceae bacterium]|nr:hypothetical protein [Saprospiraceae bacterium]